MWLTKNICVLPSHPMFLFLFFSSNVIKKDNNQSEVCVSLQDLCVFDEEQGLSEF